ncbi:MAG: DUF6077 domain-containing protein [Myxococcota bacterium]
MSSEPNDPTGIRLFWLAVDSFNGAFAAWTLLCWSATWFGIPFRVLLPLAPLLWISVGAGIVLAAVKWPLDEVWIEDSSVRALDRRRVVAGLIACAIAFWIFGFAPKTFLEPGFEFWAWFVASSALAYALWPWLKASEKRRTIPHRPSSRDDRNGVIVALFLSLGAMAVTLIFAAPNLDDAFYLNVVVTSLEHPELPPLSFDGLHGEPGLPLLMPAYRVLSHLLAVSAASAASGLSSHWVYYTGVPALMAVLSVLAHALVLRHIVGRRWAWALLALLVITISWGHTDRLYASFMWIKLFQGKCILIAFCIPALLACSWRYADTGHRRHWIALCAALITAAGMSPTALVVAPVSVALALAARVQWNRPTLRRLFIGGLCVVPCLVELLLIRVLHPEVLEVSARSSPGELVTVIGRGLRGGIAFTASSILLLLAHQLPRGKHVRRYAALAIVVVLCPAVPVLASELGRNFSWRIFWAFPLPLIVASALAALTYWRPGRRLFPAGWIAASALLVMSALSGASVIERVRNHPRPELLLDFDGLGPIARAAVEFTPRDGMLLAATPLAGIIATLPERPRLASVRTGYLLFLWRAGAFEDLDARERLIMALAVDARVPPDDFPFVGRTRRSELIQPAVELIDKRGVDVVAFVDRNPGGALLAQGLMSAGYVPATRHRGYVVLVRK